MTVDDFLSQSKNIIKYSDSIMERDPDKARQLLAAQLQECNKLIQRLTHRQERRTNESD